MLAFRGLDNARSFGVPTAGYTTGNMVVTMPDQAQMMLTVAQVKDRTGEIFNDTAIQPDEVSGDDPMDEARNWLTAQRSCTRVEAPGCRESSPFSCVHLPGVARRVADAASGDAEYLRLC
ncbi:hypothetical protein EAH68_14595 [Corynebacterium hylobatis]|uniref:Uncharacterized protein n=1 Tax=Corynebacterium hylobatis TaxID=1859290 RepID=A0A430HUM5_9CORY|nr:hypothetical protein EAH68_14595 [Corynebacterium hylobatis]